MSETPSERVAYRPTKATKAWVAAGVAFVSFLVAAFGDDAFTWGEVGEGISLLVTTVIGGIAVYQTRNDPK